MNEKTLFVVASGSGGHILPALILAKEWKIKNLGNVVFFTGVKNLDKTILDNNSFIEKKIYLKLSNFPGKKVYLYPKFIWQFIFSYFRAIYWIKRYKNITVISTGGYLAIPVCLAAKRYKQDIILYELNVVPGKAIKFLSKLATKINIVFENSKHYFSKKLQNKINLTNYPLRYSEQDKIFDKQKLLSQINLQDNVNFDINKKTIFVLGGSQGSVSLNNYFKGWLEKYSLHDNFELNNVQVIHQTGALDKTNWQDFYKNLNIQAIVFSYRQDLKDYYLLSDLVFARAGAGTLFELEFFQKRSFIFPLRTGYTSHQVDNAKFMVERNKELFEIKQL